MSINIICFAILSQDKDCHPNLEQFLLAPLSTKENSSGLNHYQGHLPENDCNQGLYDQFTLHTQT